jgi:membrane-associated phospholipid phosphatase
MDENIIYYIHELERMSPIFIFLYLLYQTKLDQKQLIVPFLYFLVTNPINNFFKNFVFKPLMKEETFPIIGCGHRPIGAKNTGIISTGNVSTSYGMPSGHSQGVGFFLLYELLFKKYNIIGNIILILICFYLLYSRINLGCHTTQQTLIGFTIGALFAYIFFILTTKNQRKNVRGNSNKKKKNVTWAPPSTLCKTKLIENCLL